jgi:hypothetical protein
MIAKITPRKSDAILMNCDYQLKLGEEKLDTQVEGACWFKVGIPLTLVEEKLNEVIEVINQLLRERNKL